jgi:hypothetical protein
LPGEPPFEPTLLYQAGPVGKRRGARYSFSFAAASLGLGYDTLSGQIQAGSGHLLGGGS